MPKSVNKGIDVASNDWKAELKRRIEDIKEKKKQEKKTASAPDKPSIKEEVQKSIAQAQKKKAEAEVKPEEATENTERAETSAPARKKPVPRPEADNVEKWPKTRHNAKPVNPPAPPQPELKGQVFQSEDNSKDSEDLLFQADPNADDAAANRDDARREAEIRKALANASSSSRKKSKSSQKETLFPMDIEEEEPVFEPATKRQRIDVSQLDFVEETGPEPDRPAPRHASKHQAPEPTMEESIQSIDRLMDNYVPAAPLEPDPEDEPLIQAATNIEDEGYIQEPDLHSKPKQSAKRANLSEPIVVDKTHQHRNLLRIGAGIFDLIFLASIEALFIWIASMIVKTTPLSLFFGSLLPLGGMFLVLHFIYYILFTSITGQTLGKRLFQLKVVNKYGHYMGFGRGLARWILQVICLAPAALGFLIMFAMPEGSTLYDKILGTKLVRSENSEE